MSQTQQNSIDSDFYKKTYRVLSKEKTCYWYENKEGVREREREKENMNILYTYIGYSIYLCKFVFSIIFSIYFQKLYVCYHFMLYICSPMDICLDVPKKKYTKTGKKAIYMPTTGGKLPRSA